MDLAHALDLDAAPVGYHRYCDDVSLNFQCNRWVQWIGAPAGPELAAACRGADGYDAWIRVFLTLADRAGEGGRSLDEAYWVRAGEFFMPPTDPRKLPARRRAVSLLREAFGVRPVRVPYRGAFLPAYDLRPGGTPTSTWVMFGGFDSCIEELFPMAASAVSRQVRVIAFEGPGQGGALEEQGLPMTPDWHHPVAAVLDHFAVAGVTLVGGSLGGGLVIRAAAFEPRAARVVAFDVLDDFLEAVMAQLAPGCARALGSVVTRAPRRLVDAAITRAVPRRPVAQWGLWQGMHVTGTARPAGFLRAIRRYTTRDVSARVTADVLLLQGEDDHYVPGHQLARQARALGNARSVTTRAFSREEEASNHCQIGNVGLAVTTILDWERRLRAAGTTAR